MSTISDIGVEEYEPGLKDYARRRKIELEKELVELRSAHGAGSGFDHEMAAWEEGKIEGKIEFITEFFELDD